MRVGFYPLAQGLSHAHAWSLNFHSFSNIPNKCSTDKPDGMELLEGRVWSLSQHEVVWYINDKGERGDPQRAGQPDLGLIDDILIEG